MVWGLLIIIGGVLAWGRLLEWSEGNWGAGLISLPVFLFLAWSMYHGLLLIIGSAAGEGGRDLVETAWGRLRYGLLGIGAVLIWALLQALTALA